MDKAKAKDGAAITDNTEHDRAELCRVGVKVPPFYPEKPALWFAQLEGQFVLANVTTDDTKFYYTMAQLDPQYAAEVEDTITSPPKQGKYDKLKDELIKRLTASRQRKVKQLLVQEELGDRKPSQFLRRLQDLAGPGIPDDFLRAMWTNRLPESTQAIVVSQANLTLAELADLADRIYDVVTPTPRVAAVQSTPSVAAAPSSTPAAPPAIQDPVAAQIEALGKRMELMEAALTSGLNRGCSRSRARSSSRHRQRSSSKRSHSCYKRFPVCWYHHKFGQLARRCVKPCDYKAGNA